MALPPFLLTRAAPADLPEMVKLQYTAFPSFIREIFMGCTSEVDIPKCVGMYEDLMRKEPHDIWIKVVERETGALVAASNWKVHVNGDAKGEDEVPGWLEGEVREKSEMFLRVFNERRAKAMKGPFVHLHICFTDDKYRRRGAGGLMMQWGCDLADLLGLPAWIEASEEGNFLYKRFGFYDFESFGGEVAGTNMKRDAKGVLGEGGK